MELRIEDDPVRGPHYNIDLSEIHLSRGTWSEEELELFIEKILSHETIHHVLHKLIDAKTATDFDRVARTCIDSGRGDIAFGVIDEDT